jgi:uncharacterized protein
MSGRVVHFDIPAADVARAQSFYEAAFGWKISGVPDNDFKRVQTTTLDAEGNLTESGSINGGMMPRQGPVSGPVVTVDVEDIDATLAKVEELGGQKLMPKKRAGNGYIAYFRDTEDNIMGLWETARD